MLTTASPISGYPAIAATRAEASPASRSPLAPALPPPCSISGYPAIAARARGALHLPPPGSIPGCPATASRARVKLPASSPSPLAPALPPPGSIPGYPATAARARGAARAPATPFGLSCPWYPPRSVPLVPLRRFVPIVPATPPCPWYPFRSQCPWYPAQHLVPLLLSHTLRAPGTPPHTHFILCTARHSVPLPLRSTLCASASPLHAPRLCSAAALWTLCSSAPPQPRSPRPWYPLGQRVPPQSNSPPATGYPALAARARLKTPAASPSPPAPSPARSTCRDAGLSFPHPLALPGSISISRHRGSVPATRPSLPVRVKKVRRARPLRWLRLHLPGHRCRDGAGALKGGRLEAPGGNEFGELPGAPFWKPMFSKAALHLPPPGSIPGCPATASRARVKLPASSPSPLAPALPPPGSIPGYPATAARARGAKTFVPLVPAEPFVPWYTALHLPPQLHPRLPSQLQAVKLPHPPSPSISGSGYLLQEPRPPAEPVYPRLSTPPRANHSSPRRQDLRAPGTRRAALPLVLREHFVPLVLRQTPLPWYPESRRAPGTPHNAVPWYPPHSVPLVPARLLVPLVHRSASTCPGTPRPLVPLVPATRSTYFNLSCPGTPPRSVPWYPFRRFRYPPMLPATHSVPLVPAFGSRALVPRSASRAPASQPHTLPCPTPFPRYACSAAALDTLLCSSTSLPRALVPPPGARQETHAHVLEIRADFQ
ncbi:proline-rich protein 36-like [Xiphias gladius]|uniref:proline-rich protein 36-like n=1 Tax=Xiphias gladius TaxID=8245 RepID=UPI001A985314|nr:proline-rich protein 36-like [Xiphias gladius]